jgi:hypothetical protein
VTFSGLTLSDGYAAEYGGAILNAGRAGTSAAGRSPRSSAEASSSRAVGSWSSPGDGRFVKRKIEPAVLAGPAV